MMDNEIGKYVKKKESNTSKAGKKSKHKHIYEECIILDTNDKYWNYGRYFPRPLLATYCTICGKLNNLVIPHDIVEDKYGVRYRSLTKEEIRVRYSHLPHFTIENWYKTKYVNLEN